MNYEKNPRLAKTLARRQKGLRKKLKKHQHEMDFEDGGHIGSQDIALAEWDISFENYDEEDETERKRGT